MNSRMLQPQLKQSTEIPWAVMLQEAGNGFHRLPGQVCSSLAVDFPAQRDSQPSGIQGHDTGGLQPKKVN